MFIGCYKKKSSPELLFYNFNGAGNETLTRGLILGKDAL